jgi:site-specific DNA-methyltransferase (adenine-specific)
MSIKLYQGDCLEVMKTLDPQSIDMVLTDPPYGTTNCKWDSVIDLPTMWGCIQRFIKANSAIALTANQPFTSRLVSSNYKLFRYCWVWEKVVPTGHLNAKKMPMKWYEEVVIFYQNLPTYNPQLRTGKGYNVKASDVHSENYGKQRNTGYYKNDGTQYKPKDIIGPFRNINGKGKLHPTQKPLALMEYLIKTYTNEGDTVLDFTMGSGTTGVACKKLKRDFIGIELDKKYFGIAKRRLRRRVLA